MLLRRRFLVLLLSGIALHLACASASSAQNRVAVAIVVNRSHQIGDMSFADVRKLYLGERGTAEWTPGNDLDESTRNT